MAGSVQVPPMLVRLSLEPGKELRYRVEVKDSSYEEKRCGLKLGLKCSECLVWLYLKH